FSTIQPVIFVLMFRYVFGGAIKLPGRTPYVDYLMPGIFVQTVVFGSLAAAIGLATDLKSGLLERFRSLPMARSAVLAGRTFAVLAPLVFASSAFVPVSSMPAWLQVFARHQPVSVTVSAVRDLVLVTPAASDLLQALAWMAAIVLVFAPLAVRRYRRAV